MSQVANMSLSLFKRSSAFASSVVSSHLLPRLCSFCTQASRILGKDYDPTRSDTVNGSGTTSADYATKFHLSPLFSNERLHNVGYDVELVDPDTWRVSSGLAQSRRQSEGASVSWSSIIEEDVDGPVHCRTCGSDDPNFEEIEDMRIRGNLFYKLDRDSKEFEEYNLSFPGKKSSRNKENPTGSTKSEPLNCNAASVIEKSKKGNSHQNMATGVEKVPKFVKNDPLPFEMESSSTSKKTRVPTFNQLTAPYHEPFCLDIYVSKGSVRACVIHRVTSKVVAVAHSISKDMKFDLGSTRDSAACAAVGAALAQRALADDIHDVVYTPRKGEKLEGKLEIVLQSVIDNGLNVKVKIKQRRTKKGSHLLAT